MVVIIVNFFLIYIKKANIMTFTIFALKNSEYLKKFILTFCLGLFFILFSQKQITAKDSKSSDLNKTLQQSKFDRSVQNFIEFYLKLGDKMFTAAYKSSLAFKKEVISFLDNPTQASFSSLKLAYTNARFYYQQTEVFRFANEEIDNLEDRVNAWPVDESFLDYVKVSGSVQSNNNLVFSSKIKNADNYIKINNNYDHKSLRSLHELGGDESKVTTGFHAIEFMLWGQDLNGFNYGAGNRSYTDYTKTGCVYVSCDKRRAYLLSLSSLLSKDLALMSAEFKKGGKLYDRYQKTNPVKLLKKIMSGLISFSYGELAGERIQLGLILNDPEEEHDCFSDLTHHSHYYNLIGIYRVLFARYDFNKLSKPDLTFINQPNTKQKSKKHISLYDIIKIYDKNAAKKLKLSFEMSYDKMKYMFDKAESGMSYDMMLDKKNNEGKKILDDVVASLRLFSSELQNSASAIKINNLAFDGSDSLDNPAKIYTQSNQKNAGGY